MDAIQVSHEHVAPLVEDQWRAALRKIVAQARKSQSDIALEVGLTKQQLSRLLNGARRLQPEEIVPILRAAGAPPTATLLFMLTDRLDLATDSGSADLAGFIEEYCTSFTSSIERVLGDRVVHLNPKWGRHTAELTARLLAKHIDERIRHDEFADVRLFS